MTATAALADALATVAHGAAERDREPRPRFPGDAVAALERAGVLAGGLPFSEQLEVVRDVARADPAVARIVDGHLNAVERLAVHGEEPLREDELQAVAAGRLRLGVWGADPRGDEGDPARIVDGALRGTKTFCSGAGGLHRAIVLAGDRLAYVDLTRGTTVDEGWFAGAGMRASVSHRVVFDGAPVLAVLGPPGRDRAGAVVRARRGAHRRDMGGGSRRPRRRGGPPAGVARAIRPTWSGSPPAGSAPSSARWRCGSPRVARRGDAGTLGRRGRRVPPPGDRGCEHPARRRGGARLRLAPVRDRRRTGPRPPRPRAVRAPAPPRSDRRPRGRGRAGGGPVSIDPATFERMYRAEEDPWSFETSAYEAAKYEQHGRGPRRAPVPPRPGARLLDRRPHRAARRALRRAVALDTSADGRRAGTRPRGARPPTCGSRRCRTSCPRDRSTSSSPARSSTTSRPACSRGCSARSRPRWSPAACCSPSTGARRRARTRCAATTSTRSWPHGAALEPVHAERTECYRLDLLRATG